MRLKLAAFTIAGFLACLLSSGCSESAGASLSPRQAEIAPGVWAQRLTGQAHHNDEERQIDLIVVFRSAASGRDAATRYRSVDNSATMIGHESIEGAKQKLYELTLSFLEDRVTLWDQSFDLNRGSIFVLDREQKMVSQSDLEVTDLADPKLATLAVKAR
jgi:hypothetical protein